MTLSTLYLAACTAFLLWVCWIDLREVTLAVGVEK